MKSSKQYHTAILRHAVFTRKPVVGLAGGQQYDHCLQTLRQTTQAFELTAKELEKAARGVERATLVFQLDVPHTLASVERAGNEVASLAEGFNITGSSKDKKKSKKKVNRGKAIPQEGDEPMPELLGRHGMQRVVQDISTMTTVRALSVAGVSKN